MLHELARRCDMPTNLFDHALANPSSRFDEPTHLPRLLNAIAGTGKWISSEINRADLRDILGSAGSTNVTDDEQQKLDLMADKAMADALASTGLVCAMASEENPDLIEVSDIELHGPYAVAFDPVDGSSNIDVAAPIGTIFGIYRRVRGGGPGDASDLLQPGSAIIAAGYVLYGSSTICAYSVGDGVHYFTLDPTVGEWTLTRESVKSHGDSLVYSVNEGNSKAWHDADVRWVEYLKSNGYSGRYIGALVADFHRNLQKGGIYAYPGDRKSPSGKLRLLFEAAPLAFIAEQAGGAATDGTQRILDIRPDALHQRTPLYIGNSDQVETLRSFKS